jgi:Uma2 family endonuclease
MAEPILSSGTCTFIRNHVRHNCLFSVFPSAAVKVRASETVAQTTPPAKAMMGTAMAVAELLSAEQYLHSSFEHDAEFVEGRLIHRPMPTWEHACMQGFLVRELWAIGRRLGLFAVPEQRVQTRPDRFRVPDVCVVADKPEGEPGRRIVTRPPYLCVEILSPEDTAVETLEKIGEYLDFGVAWVWVIDPVSLTGQIHSRDGVVSAEDGIFSTNRFSVDISKTEF